MCAVARDERIFDSGSINADSDMSLYYVVSQLVKAKPTLLSRQERQNGFTPLHEALKSGNLELALWLLKLAPADMHLLDICDRAGMRAIDLLAFKVDDAHKSFIKESPGFENNYKIKKVF